MENAASILFGKTRQAVLAALFDTPGSSFYVRELARLTRISPGALQTELSQLLSADLVCREEDGNRVHYRANTAHPVFQELRALVQKTCGLPIQLQHALVPLQSGIELALLYGSVAKGQEHARSDVDLLIVGHAKLETLLAALQPVEQRLGREISVRLFTPNEFRRKRKSGDRFINGILTGSHQILSGALNDAG